MPRTSEAPREASSLRLPRGALSPNLVRDEWVNIGILLFDPANGRILRRMMEEPGEFARVRRLHPGADEDLLRRLPEEFDANSQRAPALTGPIRVAQRFSCKSGRLEQTLSNAVQLSAQKGLWLPTWTPSSTGCIAITWSRRGIAACSRIWPRATPSAPAPIRFFAAPEYGRVSSAACAWPNSPSRRPAARRLRLSAQRHAGLRAGASARPRSGPGQGAGLHRRRHSREIPKSEFVAVTEVEPRPQDNPRHRFVTGLLEERQIPVVPLARLADWAFRLRPALLGGNSN